MTLLWSSLTCIIALKSTANFWLTLVPKSFQWKAQVTTTVALNLDFAGFRQSLGLAWNQRTGTRNVYWFQASSRDCPNPAKSKFIKFIVVVTRAFLRKDLGTRVGGRYIMCVSWQINRTHHPTISLRSKPTTYSEDREENDDTANANLCYNVMPDTVLSITALYVQLPSHRTVRTISIPHGVWHQLTWRKDVT